MIELDHITKRYGPVVAVDDLSFGVEAGRVTGFLGPNGAGKSTTLRILLGLVRPDAGAATIAGRPYRELPDPLRAVGAALDAHAFHPGRSARDHLRALAIAAGLPRTRADEALALVEMTPAADRRVGGYSLGMKQRLALAAALLGDPHVLILDEPANGLDPRGMRWLRDRLRGLADEGRTVLVSSHVLAEVAQTADDVVVVRAGRLIAQGTVTEISRATGGGWVRARSRRAAELAELVRRRPDVEITRNGDADVVLVRGLSVGELGELAGAHGLALHELREETASLEDAFLELTHDGSIR